MANGPISVPCAAWSTNVFQMLFLSLGNCEAKPSQRQAPRHGAPLSCLLPVAGGPESYSSPSSPTHPQPKPSPVQSFPGKPSPRLLSLTSFLSPLIDENAVIIVGFRSAGPLVGPRLRRMLQLLILHQLPEPMGLLDAQRGSLIQVENDVRAEREAG